MVSHKPTSRPNFNLDCNHMGQRRYGGNQCRLLCRWSPEDIIVRAWTGNHIPQNPVICNNWFMPLPHKWSLDVIFPRKHTTDTILTSLLRQNDVAVPFEYNNDVIFYVLCTLRYCILCPVYEDPIFNGSTGCDYWSMPGLKLIHVSKTGPWRSSEDIMAWTSNHISHNGVMRNYLFTH